MVDLLTLDLLFYLIRNPNHHLPESSLSTKINWVVFIKYLHLNKAFPFAEHLLKCPKCRKKIPTKHQYTLEATYLSVRLKWEIQKKEGARIYRTLYREGVSAVPFKDYSCWGMNYPGTTFPQKADIDIFITKKNYSQIDRIMSSLGYQPIDLPFPKDKFALLEKDYTRKIKRAPLLINFHFKDALPGTDGKVNPLSQPIIDRFSKLFVQSLKKDKNGFLLPSFELNFIFLCLHFFFRDKFAGLRTLYEISQYIGQFNEKINWDYTLKITREMKVESYFLFVIKIANSVFDVELPGAIEQRISCVKSVNIALKFYFPRLTAIPDGPEEFLNPKKNKKIWAYYFFIKLILWQKPFWKKLGPTTIILFFIYFIPTYFLLKRNDKSSLK